MTLTEQIAMIDSIVKKDKDFTIKDYLELVKEMDGIGGPVAVPIIRASKMNEEPEKKKYSERKGAKKYLRTYKFGT